MAHHTYKTRAFVLDLRESGEEHAYLALLTEEIGLVRCVAKSARSVRSRFRYHVQPMSFGDYALVRGREVWRLIGAQATHNFYFDLQDNQEAIKFLGRFSSLLRRLLVGEEQQRDLFSLVEGTLAFLHEHSPRGEVLENLEYVVVLRTLLALGYIGEHRAFDEQLCISPLSIEMLQHVSPLRRALASEINRALRESHL